MSSSSAVPPRNDADPPSGKPPGRDTAGVGFGGVARKTARRTTDLLAIALVLVAGLGLGRQLVSWWRADSEDAREVTADESSPAAWGREHLPLVLEFGDSPFAVERTLVRGGNEAAVKRLIDRCADLADARPATASPASPAERRLLKAVAGLAPVRQRPGRWQVYVADGPVVLAAAVQIEGKPVPADVSGAPAPGDVSAPGGLLCWGLAFPVDEGQWTLYTFQSTGQRPDSRTEESPACLPPGSQHVLSARDAAGGGLTVFEGSGRLRTWKQSIESCMKQRGYRQTSDDGFTSAGWSTRFETTDGPQATIDVHLFHSPHGPLTGVITTTRHTLLTSDP